ncbi:MAG: transglycosylase domain-containing protein, partial [Candidatus Aegiribacteria sp.]|nr:transglycosylase domain-containing protein [Candidatus Aegiribacteria sp.]
EMLQGFVIEGRISASRSDHIFAEGMITEVDGESAEVYFELDDYSGSPFVRLSTDLANVRDVLIAQAENLLGDVYIDFEPSGYFTLEFIDENTVGVSIDAMLDSVRMYSPALADDTVNTAAALRFNGAVCINSWDVSIDSGSIVFGGVPVSFDLCGRFNECTRLSLRLWNDSLPGEDITSFVPLALLGRLEGLQLGGEASFDILVELDWETPDSSDFQALVDVSDLSVRVSPISIGQLRYGGSCLMRDSWGGRRRVYFDTLTNPGFVLFDSLHPSFEGLLKCAEDATFRYHDGFCEYHIRNSIRANMESGEFTRGGSTITMQLARNLFLGREKTFARKIQEVFLTWRLEVYLSK